MISQAIFVRIDARFRKPEMQRTIEPHIQLLSQAFLQLNLAVLKFIELETLARRSIYPAHRREIGQRELMQADQQRGAGAERHRALDGFGPDPNRLEKGCLKNMQRKSIGVQGGGVIVQGPAGIVGGDGGDDFGLNLGESIVTEVFCKQSGDRGVVGLGDEKEVFSRITADHWRIVSWNLSPMQLEPFRKCVDSTVQLHRIFIE